MNKGVTGLSSSSSEVDRCRRAIDEKKKRGLKVPLDMHLEFGDALKADLRTEEAAEYYKKLLSFPEEFTDRERGLINHEIGSCYVNMYDFRTAYIYLSRAIKNIKVTDPDFENLSNDIEIAKKYQKVQQQIQQLEKKLRIIRERGCEMTSEDKRSFVIIALEASEHRRSYGDKILDHFIPLFRECESLLKTENNSDDLVVKLYFYWNEVLYENADYDESSDILNKLLSILCDKGEISNRRTVLLRCLLFMGNTRAKKAHESNNDADYEEKVVMETYDRAENEAKEWKKSTTNENIIEVCNEFLHSICIGRAEFYREEGKTQKYEKWLTEASKYRASDSDDDEEEEEEEEENNGNREGSSSSSSSSSESSDDEVIAQSRPTVSAEKRKIETNTKRGGRDSRSNGNSTNNIIDDTPAAKRNRLEEIVKNKMNREKKAKESLQFSSSEFDADGNLKPCFRDDFFDNDLGETFKDYEEDDDDDDDDNDEDEDEEEGNDDFVVDDDDIIMYSNTSSSAKKTTTTISNTSNNRQRSNKSNTLDRFLVSQQGRYSQPSTSTLSTPPSSSKTSFDTPLKHTSPLQKQQQKPFSPPKTVIVVQPPSLGKKNTLTSFFGSKQNEQSLPLQQQQQSQLRNDITPTSTTRRTATSSIIVQVDIDLYNFTTKFAINESQSVGDITRKAIERYELTRKQRLAIGMDLELDGAVLVEDDPISGLIKSGDTLKLVPQAITPDTPGVNPRVRAAVSATSVSSVSLSGVKLDELSFSALCGALPNLASLERLDLRGCGLCAKQGLALSNALQSTGELRELDVSHNPLECGATQAELKGIASLFYVATLESLDISAARLSLRTIELLADSAGTIIGVPNVRRIDISGNQLGSSLPLFVRAISHLTRLCELRADETFQRCVCDGKGDGEGFPASLRTLRFSGNTLGDAGATFLAAALPPGIRFVDVAGCALGPAAARALMCSGTEALDISNNDVGAELANALSNNCVPKLAALKASRCGLGMAGLSMVLRAAAGCSYLSVLIVDENVPLAAGQSQISSLASKCFPQLTFLDLSRNGVAKEDAESLSKTWKKDHDGSKVSSTSLSPYSGARISNVTVTESALVFGDRSTWQRLTQDLTKRRKD